MGQWTMTFQKLYNMRIIIMISKAMDNLFLHFFYFFNKIHKIPGLRSTRGKLLLDEMCDMNVRLGNGQWGLWKYNWWITPDSRFVEVNILVFWKIFLGKNFWGVTNLLTRRIFRKWWWSSGVDIPRRILGIKVWARSTKLVLTFAMEVAIR